MADQFQLRPIFKTRHATVTWSGCTNFLQRTNTTFMWWKDQKFAKTCLTSFMSGRHWQRTKREGTSLRSWRLIFAARKMASSIEILNQKTSWLICSMTKLSSLILGWLLKSKRNLSWNLEVWISFLKCIPALRYGKKGNKKSATCFVTWLQNELNGNVARFITHEKKNLEKLGTLVSCKTGSNVGRLKHVTSLFNLFWSNVAKQVARFLLPVLL